jgi:hypothetical protein
MFAKNSELQQPPGILFIRMYINFLDTVSQDFALVVILQKKQDLT